MDKIFLRSLFEFHKGFLKKLYAGEESPHHVLSVSSDRSLDVLIRILHLIAIGEIVLRRKDSSILKNSRKLKTLQKFESKKNLLHYLNESRETKLKLLKQLGSVYRYLLYSFFNEM